MLCHVVRQRAPHPSATLCSTQGGRMQGLLGTYELLCFFHCRFEQERLCQSLATASDMSQLQRDPAVSGSELKNAFDLTKAALPPH
jgi:hypothetical protein